jgi:hypothetical protein
MIYSFLLSIFIIFIIYLISGSLASLAILLFTLLSGILLCNTIEKKNRQKGLYLFFIVFSIYTLFALFHFLSFSLDYQNFALDWRDEYKYFTISESYSYASISKIFKDCFIDKIHIENEGYIFYIATLSSIAQSLFDGNHLLYQFLGTTLVGTLNSILLYKLLLLYVKKNDSFKNALIFMLFSAAFQYSFFLLRDIFILFFYLCGFIIISKRFSFQGLVELALLAFLIWNIRFEHGLFFIIFILYYIYIRFKKYKVLFIIIFIALCIASFSIIERNTAGIIQTYRYYSAFTQESALSVEGSLGKIIYTMPSPAREVGILLNSQIQPFPSWNNLVNSNNIFSALVGLLPIVYSLFWFVIIFSLFRWLILSKKYRYLSTNLILLLAIGIAFLVGNLVNPTLRRLLCIYPIFFLVYTILKSKTISKSELKKTSIYATSMYLYFIIVYIVIKNV